MIKKLNASAIRLVFTFVLFLSTRHIAKAQETEAKKFKDDFGSTSLDLSTRHVAKAQETEAKQAVVESKQKIFKDDFGFATLEGSERIATIEAFGTITVTVQEFIYSDSNSERGVSILVHQLHGFTGVDRFSSTLVPYKEIESLIKGIDYILGEDGSATKLTDFDAAFFLKCGLSLRKSVDTNTSNGSQLPMKILTADGTLAFFKDRVDLVSFKVAIIKAKARLDSLQTHEIKK